MSTHKESIVCSYLLDAHAYHSGWYLESDCRRRRLSACHVCRRCRRQIPAALRPRRSGRRARKSVKL